MRFDFQGTCLDALRFIRCNKFKFLIAFLLVLAGGIFGIVNALALDEVTRQGLMRFNVFRVLSGERGFWGYFFFRFLLLAAIATAVSFLGIRPFLAWIGLGLLLLFAYQAAFFIAIMFAYAGFSVLPLMLIAIVPFTLIIVCIFIFYVSFILCFSVECKVTCFFDLRYFLRNISMPYFLTVFFLFIAAILETLLLFLLSGTPI